MLNRDGARNRSADVRPVMVLRGSGMRTPDPLRDAIIACAPQLLARQPKAIAEATLRWL
jgi:hypothetical protein